MDASGWASVGSFFGGITADVTTAYKTFNAPTGVQVPGTPTSPATGLPKASSSGLFETGASMSTILLGLAVAILGIAFFFSVRK